MSVLGGIGLALGGIGSLVGGATAASAARQQNANMDRAMNLTNERQAGDMLRLLTQLYGPQRAMQEVKLAFGNDVYSQLFGGGAISGEQEARVRALQDQLRNLETGGSSGQGASSGSRGASGSGVAATQARINARTPGSQANDNTRAIADIRAEIARIQSGGATGRMSEQDYISANSGQTITDQYRGLQGVIGRQGQDVLSQFDQGQASLLQGAQGLEDMASQYGEKRMQTVERDAGRALKSANQRTLANANNSGIASGALLNRMTEANRFNVNEQAQDQINALQDQRLGQMLTLGGERLRMQQAGNQQRTGLLATNADRELAGLRTPLDLQANMLASPAANPGASVNTQPLFNMASPSAAFAQPLASFASGLGGQLYGDARTSQLLDELTRANVGNNSNSTAAFASRRGT